MNYFITKYTVKVTIKGLSYGWESCGTSLEGCRKILGSLQLLVYCMKHVSCNKISYIITLFLKVLFFYVYMCI
jgi:hypothetical protein